MAIEQAVGIRYTAPMHATATETKRGILLLNLGSPDSTEVPDVRRYLHQFLMDKYVIDVPWLLRKFIVCGTILPKRPAESAEAYASIWWDEGSPLKVFTERLAEGVRGEMQVPLEVAMRYQNPSIEVGLRALVEKHGVNEVVLVPLYPHYAMSSTLTSVVETQKVLSRVAPGVKLHVMPSFYKDPLYIDALVESSKESLGDYDHLLISFHGLPERHLHKTDPTGSHCLSRPDCCEVESLAHETCYRHQCYETAKAYLSAAGIPEGKWSIAFQSRLGRDPWLLPATDAEVVRLAKEGVKRMAVICPAFVADCLETLEEIGMRAKEDFQAAGGEDLWLVPCMNTHPAWIKALSGLIAKVP